jgi:16S rRNA (cytosine967-C5)-methyltransferase
MKTENPRDLALIVLNGPTGSPVSPGGTLDGLFRSGVKPSPRDRAFLNNLVQGVLRWRLRLDWILEQTSHLPLRKIDPPVLNILRIAVYQIFFMDRVPESAAVNEAVRQAKAAGPRHIASFVNGVLRNVCRSKGSIPLPDREKDRILSLSVQYSYPQWLVRMWDRDRGTEFTEHLLDAGNRLPKLTLRTNTLKTGREELIERLSEEGVACSPAPYAPDGIRTDDFKGRVDRLDAFREGLFQVQDEAAQVATYLLDPLPGERVLDACAGLGGKASHMAERMGHKGLVAALDIHFRRLLNLRASAARLGIRSIYPVAGDSSGGAAIPLKGKWDRILVDAPCSGLGVISRHPDVKWNRTEEDLERLSRLQSSILKGCFPLLRPGGTLLYVTCTLSKVENEGVVETLLRDREEARLVDLRSRAPEWCRGLIDENGFFRTFPHVHDMDGFFGALFERRGL